MGRKNKRETNLTGDDRDTLGRANYGESLFIQELERELGVHKARHKKKMANRRKRNELQGRKKRQKKRAERFKSQTVSHEEEG